MAGKGIEIDIAANTREFQRGTKDVEGALEDVADSLDDLARDADKAGDKLGDELSDGAKDAEKGVERLERSFKDLADGSKRSTAAAGDALKKNTKDATTQAQRDLEELKDEAIQNASETFSSFDGSVDSFVDGIQGTFGGIVSNMGPIGAAAGAALAMGIGLAVAKGEEVAEAINTAKERAASLASELIDADGDISQIQWAEKVKEWGLAIQDSRELWEFWQEDAKTGFDVASEAADRFGLSMEELSRGLSGVDSDAATRSISQLREQIDELGLARARADNSNDREKIKSEIRVRENLVTKLQEQGGATEEAVEQYEKYLTASAEAVAADKEAAEALQARTDSINALQGELDDAIGSWQEYQDAETGAVDPAAYIAAMQERMLATQNFNANVQTLATQFGLTADEVQTILDQGVDFAPMLQGIINSGMSEAYVEQVRSMLDGGQRIVDGTPITATVKTTVETQDAERQLSTVATRKRSSTTVATADTKDADSRLTEVANRKRTAPITARADIQDAERQLSALIAKPREITLYVNTVERKSAAVRW